MINKKNFVGVIIFLTTLAFFLLMAEIVFRINGKYSTFNEKNGAPYHSVYDAGNQSWYHVYTPHQKTSQALKEYSYSLLANNEGFLDKEFGIAKKSNSIRIMILGDSFVQGMGAGADSVCPKLLENILKTKYAADLDIEVWNCGIANSDPYFEYKLLADKLLKYKPDYVIDLVNSTDISDITLRGGFERFKQDTTVRYKDAPYMEPLYASSFLLRRITHDILGYNWMFMRPSQAAVAESNSKRLIESILFHFKQLCASNNISFLAVLMPRDMELKGIQVYPLEGTIKFCDSVLINEIDIKSCLEAKGFFGEKSQKLYWPIDGHFNAQGYRNFAVCLSEKLVEYCDSVKCKNRKTN